MNKIYKVVFNKSTGTFTAVTEFAKAQGKTSSGTVGSTDIDSSHGFKLSVAVGAILAALATISVTSAYAATQVTVSGVTAMSGGSQVYVETNSTRVAVGFETVANSGEWSTSVGSRANATGGSTSIGYAAISSQDSTAIGAMATAGYTVTRNTGSGAVTAATKSGNQAVALGYKATASGDQSLAIGGDTRALGGASIAIGGDDLDAVSKANLNGSAATALNGGNINTAFKAISGVDLVDTANQYPGTTFSGQGAVAIGVQAVSAGHLATAVGTTSNASGMAASALGVASQADGNGSIAIGPNAVTNSTGTEGIAIGARTRVTADSAVAIANGSTATGVNAVAIANTSSATANDAIAIGNSTDASALRAAALGANATASGMDSIAIGTNTTSSGQNANAMGLSANSSGTSSFAMGTRANASGESAYAIGTDAIANNTKSIAIGSESKSSEDKTIAIGDRANASGYHGISIGAAAAASGNTSMALGDQAIASSNYSFAAGGLANATAQYATAIGANANATGEYSTALGKSANATGRMATALGINTNATGPNATAVGSNATAAGTGGLAMGVNAVAGRTGTGALNNAIAIGTNASSVGGHSSIATGTNATASNHNAIATGTDSKAQQQGSIAIGQNATSANIHALALGTNATANLDRSVALGAYSTVSAAVDTNQATIGAITYSGFAGNAPADGDVVSVGSADRKRQIQNVAAGQITATSTDAINGSQLYVTNSVLSTLANSVKTEFGGDAALNPNTGEITFSNIGNTGKGNIHDAIAAVKEDVVAGSNVVVTPVTAANGSTTYTVHAKDTTANHSAASADFLTVTAQPQANNVTNYETALTTRATDALKKAETAVQNIASPDNSVVVNKVGDTTNLQIRRGLGITLDSNGGVAVANTTLVQSATTMRFSTPRGQQNSFVKADDLARHLNDVGFKLSGEPQGGTFEDLTAGTAEKQLRTGDTLTMIAGPNIKINQVNKGFEFSVEGENVAYAGNKATVPADAESVATAKSVAEAINHAGFTLKTSAVTGGNKLGGSDEVINPADTVEMIAGKNLTVFQEGNGRITYTTKDDVTFNTTTTNNLTVNPNGNVNMGGNTINNVGSGGDVNTNAANIGDVKKAKTEVEAGSNVNVASRTGDNGQTIYTVNAHNTTAASVSPDYISVAGKPATAANTTNYEIGLTDKAITDFTKDTQATVVSTDGTVTVKNADRNANGTVVYDLSVNTSVPTTELTTDKGNVSTTAPTSYVTAGNLATTINSAVASAKEKVVAGTNIASVEPQVDDTTGATTYTVNAKGATASAGSDKVTVTPTAKDGNITDYAVDLSQAAKDSLNKADTAIQQFTTAVKGATVDTINQQNTVINFVDGAGTTATVKDSDITFDVNKADLTTDTAGNVTSNKTGDNFVTGDDVAKAINEAAERTEKTTTVAKGSNTHVQAKEVGNNTEYTVSADKSTVSVSSALTKTETPTTDATTGAVTTDYALDLSQTTKDDIKKGVDAKDIVDTEGLTFTGDSGTTTEKLLGSSVAVNGDNNITTEATADAINIKLNKDITVNSVTANTTTTNNLKVNPNGNVDMGGNQITNVASGGDVNTNAANIGDVKKAKTEVKAGTNIVDVVKTEGDNGQDIYTVNAKDTTATHADSSKDFLTVSDAQDKGGNVKNFETALTARATDALKAAETAVQNFKVAVNGADVQTVANGDTVKFVNGTGTTARNASGQITFDINKSTLTTDAAGNVTNNTAGDTFVTGDDVAKAINEAAERTEKTTTVVKGSNTHVKSNVVGNNTEYTVSADKSTVSVSEALKMEAKPTTDANEAVTTEYALDLSDKTKEDIKKGVDAKNIVDTEGLTFTGDSGTTTEKLLGSSVAVNGDNNITTEATADAINIKLNKDITVNSVTANTTTTNNLKVNPNGNVDMGGNQITNVASGGDVNTNAANIGDVKKAKTEVKAGTNIVDVVKTEGDNGQDIYTVNAKDTTATHADSSKDFLTVSDAQDKGGNVKNFETALTARATDALKAAETAVQNFKVAVNGADVQTVANGDTVKFVNGTGTTARNASGQITFDINKSTLTTDAAGNVTNNTAGDTFVTGDDVAKAINEAAERTEKTTTVVKGSNTHVKSNVVGNNTEYTVSADKSTVSVSEALKMEAKPTTDANEAVTTEYALDLSDKTKEDIKKGVDAKNIVDTEGLTFTGDSGTTTEKLLGSSVAVNGDNNITTEATADAINIKLNKDITVNSVTANTTTTNNLKVNPNGNVDMGGNQITNVASGGDVNTNAANIGDVKKAKTEVKAGTNIVDVVKTEGDNGQDIYTVNAKDTTATHADSSKDFLTVSDAQDKGGNVKNFETALTARATDALKAAETAVQNFKVAVNGADVQTVANGDTVKFVNGTGTTARNASGQITFDINKSTLTTDAAGNVTNNTAGDTFVTGDDVAKAINEAAERTEKTTTVVKGSNTHVKSNVVGNNTEYTVSADKSTVSVSEALKMEAKPTTDANEAVTTEYALDLSDKTKEDIKKGVDAKNIVDTEGLTFTGDSGTTTEKLLGSSVAVNGDNNITTEATADAINIKLNKDITVDSVTADTVNVGPVTINNDGIDAGDTNIKNVADGVDDGDAVNVKQLKASKEEVKSDDKSVTVKTTQNDAGANVYDLSVNVDETTITKTPDGKLTANTTTLADEDNDGKVDDLADDKKGNLITAGDVANAINASGFKAKANGDEGELINPGDEVEFINGSNIEITREGGKFTVATAKDVTFDSVTFGDNGPKITNNGGNINVGGPNGEPVKITNVANGDVNADSKDAVNGSQLYTQVMASREEVKSDDKSVTVTTTQNADGANVYDLSVNVDGTTITKGDNGELKANTTELKDEDNDGKVDAPQGDDAKKLVNAGDITNAINASGFKAKANGDEGELINPGDEVEFINGSNIEITREGGKFTVATAKDVTFDSVTFGDNGPKITNNGGNINVGGPNGEPVKITNVANGDVNADSKDAVNGSQLYTQVMASREEVKSDDKSVTVTTTQNADGANVYDLSVNVDGTTITKGDNGELKANTTELKDEDNDGKVDAPQGDDAKKLVNAGDITNAINASGFKAKANGDEGELINPGDEVEFINGSNIEITREGGKFTVATAKDVTFDSVTFGDNGPKITNNGGNINVGGPNGEPVKITNVANGDVNADSKDAVNGSQLYTQVMASREEVKSDDKSVTVTTTQNADGANVYDLSVNVDGTTITKGDNGELKANTTELKDEDNDGKVDAPQGDDAKKLVNAGDITNAINASGFKAKANGDEGELINPGDEVEFINGSNIEITREGGKFTVATAKDVTFDSVTFGDNGPKITNNGGNINVGGPNGEPVKITNVANGDVNADSKDAVNGSQLYTQVMASREEVKSDDKSVTVTTTQNADGANVYDLSVNVDGTTITKGDNGELKANTTELKDEDNDGKVDAPQGDDAKKLVNAGDITNAINASGFKAKANGDEGELINPGDEVEFINGSNIEITREGGKFTVATAKDVTFDSVTFGDNGPKITNNGGNINVGGPNGEPVKITNVANGDVNADSKDAVNGSQLYTQVMASREEVKSDDKSVTVTTTQNADGANVYDLSVNVDGTTITKGDNGELKANTTELKDEDNDGKVDAPQGDDAKKLVNAGDITNAINASGFKAKANGDEGELINPGDEVEFINGSNIEITREGGKFTVATAKDVTFDSVTFGDNGPKITNNGGNINVGGPNGEPVKITNVANGDVNADSKDAVNGSQLYTQVMASREEVKSDDKSVTVTTTQNADGANVYDLSVNVDGTTITKGDNGELKANTTELKDEDNDGKVDAPQGDDAKKLVNAGDITNAINASGFKAKANGDEGELINPGDEVEFINGSNIEITREGGKFTVATAKDVTFDSVTFGDNGPKITNNGGNINVGDKDGAPVKITNVKAGEDDTDAVNVSQLKAAQNAATTKVEGTQGVTVTPTTNNDGSTTYTVAAKTDGTTVKVDDNGNIAAVTTDLTNADNGKVNTPVAPNALVTAQTVTNAINNAGFNLQVNGDDADLVKTGDTVQFLNGSNIEVTRSGNDITVATKDDVTFNSVTANSLSVGPVTVNNAGINAGNTTITNVAPGVNDTDAVNVSQLKGLAQNVYGDINNLGNRIDDVDRSAKGGIASAMAFEDAPFIPGKWTYAVGAAHFGGEQAVAASLKKTADNGRWAFSGGISTASEGGTGVRIGVSGIID